MIDFDREEFLARLDIRIATITSALAYHEKYLLRDLPRKELREAEIEIFCEKSLSDLKEYAASLGVQL